MEFKQVYRWTNGLTLWNFNSENPGGGALKHFGDTGMCRFDDPLFHRPSLFYRISFLQILPLVWVPMVGMFTKISNLSVLNKMITTWKVLEFPLKWGVNHLIFFRNSRVSDEKWMLKNHKISLKIVTQPLPLTCAQNCILVLKFSQWRKILQKSAIT